MRFSWAKTPTMDEISRVNRGLMCPAVTTGCVPGGVCGGGHCASHRGHCGPEPTNVGDPCGRPAPRVARIHRTPGERSCTGVIETRNRSAWATLRFGANKFNHLSICAREGPLTGFLSFFIFSLNLSLSVFSSVIIFSSVLFTNATITHIRAIAKITIMMFKILK